MEKELFEFSSDQWRYADKYDWKDAALIDQGAHGVQIEVAVEGGVCCQQEDDL